MEGLRWVLLRQREAARRRLESPLISDTETAYLRGYVAGFTWLLDAAPAEVEAEVKVEAQGERKPLDGDGDLWDSMAVDSERPGVSGG